MLLSSCPKQNSESHLKIFPFHFPPLSQLSFKCVLILFSSPLPLAAPPLPPSPPSSKSSLSVCRPVVLYLWLQIRITCGSQTLVLEADLLAVSLKPRHMYLIQINWIDSDFCFLSVGSSFSLPFL